MLSRSPNIPHSTPKWPPARGLRAFFFAAEPAGYGWSLLKGLSGHNPFHSHSKLHFSIKKNWRSVPSISFFWHKASKTPQIHTLFVLLFPLVHSEDQENVVIVLHQDLPRPVTGTPSPWMPIGTAKTSKFSLSFKGWSDIWGWSLIANQNSCNTSDEGTSSCRQWLGYSL